MPRHHFRIRFELSPNDRLEHEGERHEFNLGGLVGIVEFIGRSEDQSISQATELVIRSKDGYPSEEQARLAGESVSRSMLLSALSERFGIDFGKNAPKQFFTAYGREWLAEQMNFRGQLIDDVHGLITYPDLGEKRFAKFGPMVPLISRPLTRFLEKVSAEVNDPSALSNKQLLAAEIYHSSRFEHSLNARFLSLISAVEVLATRPSRSKALKEILGELCEHVRVAGIEEADKEKLYNGLREMRRESIGASCRSLVHQFAGEEAAADFKTWYDARSKLLHTGKTSLDLGSVVDKVDMLVSRLTLGTPLAAA